MMTILDEIVESKKIEVKWARESKAESLLIEQIQSLNNPTSLIKRMHSSVGFHFICEVKKASPSKGIIQENFAPVTQAQMYEKGGAAAVSVLTDEKYFSGKLDHLTAIKKAIQIPVLRKDFTIDPYQIYEARLAGADLILLIVRILSPEQLEEFMDLARQLKLEVLLEIADASEIGKLPEDLESVILGINNRDLRTFTVDIGNSLRLKKHLPKAVPVISESGIKSSGDCRILYDAGFSGALIGETLMKAADPLQELINLRKGIQVADQT